jgi:hypothetical protein
MHEVGLYTKQNSFYFQSEVIATLIEGNIMYNGPRAGVKYVARAARAPSSLRTHTHAHFPPFPPPPPPSPPPQL